MTATKVTREELYEQVWATPISKLAARYGISDVALAKTCTRLNVPRPGRGYWARLAAGERLPRPPLPKAGAGHAEWTFLQHLENPVRRPPRPTPPRVPVPKTLGRAHDAIAQLGLALGEAKPDQYERVVIGGAPQPVLTVTIAAHRRALLLLDALAKALELRGHVLTFERDGERQELRLIVGGEAMHLSVTERLAQEEHALTAAEQERAAKGYRYGIPKYDHYASGRLQISLHDVGLARSSWSDSDTRRLEGSLGCVILGAEAEIERRRARRIAEEQERKDRERERREQEEEERRQRDRQARAKHEAALVEDLRNMAHDWSEAERIRAFLVAVRKTIPEEGRDNHTSAWIAWAGQRAEGLDPLSEPARVAKRLDPSP